MKKYISVLLIMMISLLIASPQVINAKSELKLSKTKAVMELDSSLTLKVNGIDGKITWSSSNKDIASVTKEGKVLAIKEGKAIITAKVSSKTYYCNVTVVNSNKPTPAPTPVVNKYSEGVYKVGTDIPVGEYMFFSTGSTSAFALYADSNRKNSIINDNFTYRTICSLKQGEYLALNRAYAVPLEQVDVNLSNEGCFKVGVHIPSGEYKLKVLKGKNGGSYTVYGGTRYENTGLSSFFTNTSYVTVEEGQVLLLEGCAIDH